MKQSSKLWQIWGFAVAAIGGTILHFLYDWFGGAILIAPFSGVNESTWEHMKLLFWPMFVFAIVQYFFFNNRKDFWCIKLTVILFGITLIPTIFYTYNGAIGPSPDWINIAIFFISAGAAYIYEALLFEHSNLKCRSPISSLLGILIIAFLFVIFTFKTPEIGIFRDPITGMYGV